ncbi:MAG: hypothetical protein CMD36_05175 [Flavobacteriales bacterium]|nr:hypothetical protein [Flavobacteriales bacterium]|tara:strand:+ start:226 stop:1098 length:873 start_codon:yes stop_codon:yes gene_type:complete
MSKYTIDQFSQITGLNKILIRTWENRYNFVEPIRTETNIRYYTDEMLIKGIKYSILVDNGYKISKLIKTEEKEINLLIDNILNETKDEKTKNKIYISKFVQSAIYFDQKLFDHTYKKCVKEIGLIEFYSDVLLKTMNEIGVLFLNSDINPAHEHFLSENIRRKLSNETEKIKIQKDRNREWVLFLPENEFHDISLMFTNYILKSYGYKTTYLGQNVPRESLVSTYKDNTNYVFFIIAKKTDNFITNLFEFLSDNFKNSEIYFISGRNDLNIEKPNIKQIHSFNEFVQLLD